MLVFSAFTPNSPLLLPEINKDKAYRLEKTTEAMAELADELYATHPETIILISMHPTIFNGSFSIALKDPFTFDLSEFGELSFDKKIKPDIELINELQDSLRSQGQPVTLTSDETLNYASAVPLQILTEDLKNVKLVAITYSELDTKSHFQFGNALKETIMSSDKRIAVIAVGDMSHALTNNSPADFHPDGEKYDKKIQELIAQKNTVGLISLDEKLIENAVENSYRSLTILFGLLDRISVKPEILNYEAPFGVGYLVANFAIK